MILFQNVDYETLENFVVKALLYILELLGTEQCFNWSRANLKNNAKLKLDLTKIR